MEEVFFEEKINRMMFYDYFLDKNALWSYITIVLNK